MAVAHRSPCRNKPHYPYRECQNCHPLEAEAGVEVALLLPLPLVFGLEVMLLSLLLSHRQQQR
jgi:hypothetical protein